MRGGSRAGLPTTRYAVLRTLYNARGRTLTARELAKATGLTAPEIYKPCRALVNAGLLGQRQTQPVGWFMLSETRTAIEGDDFLREVLDI
jgi:DNA-binding IclR family transcriptional regulator